MFRKYITEGAIFTALTLSGIVLLIGCGRLDALDLTNGHPAKIIIGQPDMFATYAAYPRDNAPDGMTGPNNLALFSGNGHVTVTNRMTFGAEKIVIPDRKNHRVLIFNSVPATNFAPADLVLGQPDFTSNKSNQEGVVPAANTLSHPLGAAVTPTGQLVIADRDNNRILIFNTFPTTSNASADVVLGQMEFSGRDADVGNNRFSAPEDVAAYGTAIAVADRNNRRVMIWKDIRPGMVSNGQKADIVIGQKDFTSNVNNVVDRQTASDVRGVAFGPGGQIVVGVPTQYRVLIWNAIPPASGAPADLVLGQPGFTTSGAGTDASGMDNPQGVAVGKDGRLAVADVLNDRVMIWNTFPTMNGQPCQVILSGPAFADADASTLSRPSGLEWNFDDHLYVMSSGQCCVKIFDPSYTTRRMPPPPLSVPAEAWAAAGETITLPIVPGTGIPPYRWMWMGPKARPDDTPIGSFDDMAGAYTAALPNIHDQTNNGPVMFEVRDNLDKKATLAVKIYPPLAIYSSSGDSIGYTRRPLTLNASGGVNPQSGPWTWSFAFNGSGGGLEDTNYEQQKVYTPGLTFGVTDILVVKDTAGHEARLPVLVKEALQILMGNPPQVPPSIDAPEGIPMKVGDVVIFTARGGVGPPYAFGTYNSNVGISRIEKIDDLSARYTPLRPGIDRVYVNDTRYNAFTTAPIRITAP